MVMLPKIYRNDPDRRRYQINTLKIFNDNVSEVRENQEYQIPFKSGNNDLFLHVSLTQEFPNEKPILKVLPPVLHHWVNADGEVTSAPGLLNFTIHSDLGRVVQAVIREFERNPPPLLGECSGSNITSPTNSVRENDRTSPSYCAINSFMSPSHVPAALHNHASPYQSLAFPELNKLSLEELEFLNSNEDRQLEFLMEIPTIKEQNRLLDELITQVEDLAESNLAQEEQLQECREGIDKRIEEVTKLAFENERLHVKYQNLSDKYSPVNIKEQLRLAAENAEQESEQIADSFIKGDLDVDSFVSQYTKARTLCQTRKTKEEKLSQQLESLMKAGF